MVRVDIPRQKVEVDYATLEGALNDSDGVPALFGFAPLDSPGAISSQFPFTLTQVAQQLGFQTWPKQIS